MKTLLLLFLLAPFATACSSLPKKAPRPPNEASVSQPGIIIAVDSPKAVEALQAEDRKKNNLPPAVPSSKKAAPTAIVTKFGIFSTFKTVEETLRFLEEQDRQIEKLKNKKNAEAKSSDAQPQ